MRCSVCAKAIIALVSMATVMSCFFIVLGFSSYLSAKIKKKCNIFRGMCCIFFGKCIMTSETEILTPVEQDVRMLVE